MGFKLTKRIIREFRPQFATKSGPKRDSTLEHVLVHIADRTKQSANAEESPTREGGCTLSRAGLADQLGMSRNAVKGKIKTLIAMGILTEDYRDGRGVSRFSIDITNLEAINSTVWECQEMTPQGSPDEGSPSDHQGSPSDQVEGSPSDHKEIPHIDPSVDEVDTEAQYTRGSHDDHASITEPHSPSRIIGGDEENDDQGREGGDYPSSVTADSVPLPSHDASSGSAPGPSSEPHSHHGGESPTTTTESAAGAHTAPEKAEYQDVDQKRRIYGWRPRDKAYEHARAIAPDVNYELIITEYWLWCHKNKVQANEDQWMKWITRAQKQYDDAVREQQRKEAVEERRNKSWARKNGWYL